MKILPYLTLLLFVGTIYFSCAPDDTFGPDPVPCEGLNKPMPEATTEGKGTFGCLINGEPWVAYNGNNLGDILLGAEPKFEISYTLNGHYAFIIADKDVLEENCDTINQSFTLHLYTNDVVDGVNHFARGSKFHDWEIGCIFKTDTLSENQVFITRLDTINRILSCTFAFQLISEDCMDTIKITEGRFDEGY